MRLYAKGHNTRIKVAYHNVGRGSDNANLFLESCGREGIAIFFVKEAQRVKKQVRYKTKIRIYYGSSSKNEYLVVPFWRDC